jgi:prevent-host-death family protein
MREIGAFEAKNKLGTLLDLVEQGEEVTITRHGKPVARLVAPAPTIDRTAAAAAAARIRAMRRGVTLGDTTIKELIEEGRLWASPISGPNFGSNFGSTRLN